MTATETATGGTETGRGAYTAILARLIDQGVISRDDRILVQFAGAFDAEVVRSLGLRRATFANLAPDSPSSRLDTSLDTVTGDAHGMDVADGAFDHVIGHAGLHHCSRPHQALHEMYRAAARTVVVVQTQDSALMRLACRLGLATVYEFAAVADGEGTGGVDGTAVPNHVYRWTRREVRKTVNSFDPGVRVPLQFHAEWRIGTERALTAPVRAVLGDRPERGGPSRSALLTAGLNAVARRQGNIFGFVVRKDLAVRQPWVTS